MKLQRAKQFLIDRQEGRARAGISGEKKCLGDVRAALASVGLRLPWRPYPWNTAIENFKALVADPERYGWRQVHNPLEPYGIVLVYFKGCGRLKDGRIAGHVGIMDTAEGRHYANSTWPMSKYWADRLVGAFVPDE